MAHSLRVGSFVHHLKPFVHRAIMGTMLVGVICGSAAAVPSIGGVPTETDTDVFASGAGDWTTTVYSYAFLGADGVDVPVGLPTPAEGQTLFAYVPDMDDLSTAQIDQFQVGNPFGVSVAVAGHSETILPEPGYVEADRQNPSGTQVSLPALSVTYFYNTDFSFDAGEFSVLYFLSEGIPGQVPATVRGGASVTDEQQILGPVPEPSTLGVLCLAGLIAVMRRTKRS